MLLLLLLLLPIVGAAPEEVDYYALLGVAQDASEAQIKRAFRQLAREHHPDKAPEAGASDAFTPIAEAYAVLSDTAERARYDEHRRRRGPADAPKTFQRQDGSLPVTLELEAFFVGVQRDLTFRRTLPCDRCGGGGVLRVSATPADHAAAHGSAVADNHAACARCRGTGQWTDASTVRLTIPAGSVEGAGATVMLFGEPRVVRVYSLPHPVFQRNGTTLRCSLDLAAHEAVFGFRRTVLHLDGVPVVVERSQPTSNETVLTLPGRGMPQPHGRGGPGDLLVHFRVAPVPLVLDAGAGGPTMECMRGPANATVCPTLLHCRYVRPGTGLGWVWAPPGWEGAGADLVVRTVDCPALWIAS